MKISFAKLSNGFLSAYDAKRGFHVQVKNMLDIDTSLADLGHALNTLYMCFKDLSL